MVDLASFFRALPAIDTTDRAVEKRMQHAEAQASRLILPVVR